MRNPKLTILFICCLLFPSVLWAQDLAVKSQELREQISKLVAKGEYKQATPLAEQLLDLCALSKGTPEEEVLENIGLLSRFYLDSGWHRRAYDFFKELDSPEGLGNYYLLNKQYTLALQEFKRYPGRSKYQRLGGSRERFVGRLEMALAYEGLGKFDEAYKLLISITSGFKDRNGEYSSGFLLERVGLNFQRLEAYECLLRMAREKIAVESSELKVLWYAEWLEQEGLVDMLAAWKEGQSSNGRSYWPKDKDIPERMAVLRDGLTELSAYRNDFLEAGSNRRDTPFLIVNPDNKVTLLMTGGVRSGKLFLQQIDTDGTILKKNVQVISTEEIFDIAYVVKEKSILLVWTDARHNKAFNPRSANTPSYFDLFYKEIGFAGQTIEAEKKLTKELTKKREIDQFMLGGDFSGTFKEMQQDIFLWGPKIPRDKLFSWNDMLCLDSISGSGLVLLDSHDNMSVIKTCGSHMSSMASLGYGKMAPNGKVLIKLHELKTYHQKEGRQWGPSIVALAVDLDGGDNVHLFWQVNGGGNNFSFNYMKIDAAGEQVVFIDTVGR